ncbi:MAG: aminoglycoside 3'-phosphotransferase [Arachnia sp.]
MQDESGDVVIKWQPDNCEASLAAEAKRLTWLRGRFPVPELVEHRVLDGSALLVTKALPALSAVDPAWRVRAVEATRAIAEGLRRLHALDAADCPFDCSAETRIRIALGRGKPVPRQLRTPPPVDRLVVCHGDACAPNTLVADDGSFAATVDVGALGVGDRWADLAVATMSLGWNFPTELESVFWEAYGVDPDSERIRYYRALWDAT